MGKIKVLVVDRRELFRQGLAFILECEPNIRVVFTCSSAHEGIKMASELNPDIILLDTELSDCDCVEATRRICGLLPETRIIILTHSEESHYLLSALSIGARAYISKDVKVEDLIRTIAGVYSGEVIISPPMAQKMLEEFKRSAQSKETVQGNDAFSLSPREKEVLSLVSKGASNRELANTLYITENTVKVHLRKIMEKLHVHSRHQLADLAADKGIVSAASVSDAP